MGDPRRDSRVYPILPGLKESCKKMARITEQMPRTPGAEVEKGPKSLIGKVLVQCRLMSSEGEVNKSWPHLVRGSPTKKARWQDAIGPLK
jgi:hypothetical protein